MPYRITTYKQAFEDVLGLRLNDEVQRFIERLEKQGHNEHGICFAIWKTQDKLLKFKSDSRFFGILENEIKKWSWPSGDPRWNDYHRRKEEEARIKMEKSSLDARQKKKLLKTEGYIYFVQGESGGPIKIGHSIDPEKRIKELQTGYPDMLKLLFMIPGSEERERQVHKMLSKHRLNGEWFRPDAELLEKVQELTRNGGVL
jgi:hypothetical protein